MLLDDEEADLIFTYPPYNVPIDGHVCGLGPIRHREFAMGVGEMSPDAFTGFLRQTLGHAAAPVMTTVLPFIGILPMDSGANQSRDRKTS